MVENHAVFAEIAVRQFLASHDVTVVASLAAARERLPFGFDVVLVDFDLDDGKGDALVRELVASGFRGRIIAISSHDAGNAALVEAGAHAACPKARFSELGGMLSGARS